MAPPVFGAGFVFVGQGFGLARRRGPTAEREQRRGVKRAARESARWLPSLHQRRGSGGTAVVLAGCVGCRSRRAALGPGREAMGLALWLTRSRVRAQRVKRRRKPGRGGESHEHASSDTGGGLLVIPRAARKCGTRSGEGALGDGRRPGPAQAAVFDETTGEADLVTRGDGDAAALARERSGSADGHDRGRQRLCRKLGARSKTPPPGGAARRSRRSWLRQDRGAPFTWASGASAPGRGFTVALG
jgi:hypothetical protein